MSQGLTYAQAAAILGCHFSNVASLIRKGDLTSTVKRGASLNREQVQALASRRATERAARAARTPCKSQRIDLRPDQEHEWPSPRQVAELLGVTRPAVTDECTEASSLRSRTVGAIGSDKTTWSK